MYIEGEELSLSYDCATMEEWSALKDNATLFGGCIYIYPYRHIFCS